MNNTLVVFASKREFNLIYPQTSAVVASSSPLPLGKGFDVCICGVGILEFSVNLSYQLSQKKYDRVVLVGICGAYPGKDLDIGEVVRVDTEIVGDMGVQDRDGHFVPWGEVSGENRVYKGESARTLPLQLACIRSVTGVTVNCCTGTAYLAQRRSSLFNADVETMEGAACFAACKRFGVTAYQFRAISNLATDRDTSTWKVEESLAALKEFVLDEL